MVATRIAGILPPWQDAGMPATEFPPDVAALLGRLRDRLAAREDVVGVYVYGSLVTGDYSPAASDINVVVLVQREPGQVTTRKLMELHPVLRSGSGWVRCRRRGRPGWSNGRSRRGAGRRAISGAA